MRIEGGIQGSWDTKYSFGEISIGSGIRSDVMFYPTGTNGAIIQLVGNPLPAPFNLSGTNIGSGQGKFIQNLTSNYPVAYFKIVGTASPADAIPSAGDTLLSGNAAVQS